MNVGVVGPGTASIFEEVVKSSEGRLSVASAPSKGIRASTLSNQVKIPHYINFIFH